MAHLHSWIDKNNGKLLNILFTSISPRLSLLTIPEMFRKK